MVCDEIIDEQDLKAIPTYQHPNPSASVAAFTSDYSDEFLFDFEHLSSMHPEPSKIIRLKEGEDIDINTLEDGVEVVQEFSRVRFPERHCKMDTFLDNSLPSTDSSTSKHVRFKSKCTGEEELAFQRGDQLMESLVAEANSISKFTKEDIPRLKQQWFEKCADIMNGPPDELPPLREINHRIILIDEKKWYNYYLPRCPDYLHRELLEKIQAYVKAGWWKPVTVDQAAPMLCIPKKNGKLRTVVDCRRRNDNTVHDVTPLPDQDRIRQDVARANYRSKIDLSNAYEQIRIEPEDVWKTAFATIYGTLESNTMQQGDCNAPATFQRLMTFVLRKFIGIFVHVYIDDIFIFSATIEDHETHLGLIFDELRRHKLYLQTEKCDLYSERLDCLGHIIDDRGLHCDADKLAKIRQWRTPRNYNDVQKFLGLVQYLAHFLPDITAFTGPLAGMVRNGQPFDWRPLHDACFENIKAITARTLVLKPIKPSVGEPIWVICDASVSGIGAMYGQGPTWQTCRPAGFMSKKFTAAQHNYRVFELETLAILEALLKWEDKLLGHRIHVVTDHKSLEFFKTQRRLSSSTLR